MRRAVLCTDAFERAMGALDRSGVRDARSQAASWADITLKLAVYGADFAPRLDTLTERMLRSLTNCGETPLFLAARAGHMSVTPVPAWVHAELPRSGAPHWKTPDDDLPKSKATPLLMKPDNPLSGVCTARAIVALCAYYGAQARRQPDAAGARPSLCGSRARALPLRSFRSAPRAHSAPTFQTFSFRLPVAAGASGG